MKHKLPCTFLTLVGVLLGGNAFGRAVAEITLNGSPFVQLSSSGMSWNFPIFQVAAGASADFDYSWSVAVRDDGLPATFDGSFDGYLTTPTSCVPLHDTECGIPATGYEQARAVLSLGYVDPRIPTRDIEIVWTGEHFIDLQTNGDALADSWVRTGHSHLHIKNSSPGAFSFLTWGAAWAYSNPIPEPTTYAFLMFGLTMLGAVALRRRRLGDAVLS